jgi:TP901 family phage tail tape measure protein
LGTSYTVELVLKALNQASGAIKEVASDLLGLGKTTQQTQTTTEDTGKRVATSWKDVRDELDQVKTKMAELTQAANQMAMTSMRTMLAGTAIFAAAYFPVQQAAEFEKSMSLVKGVTQASSEEFVRLTDAAMKMARETVFSANEAASAMVVLARAGFTTKQIIDALPSVMYLAAAGQVAIGEAADYAAQLMNSFNVSATGLAHVVDVLAQSANASIMDIKEMADAMKYVAPAASAAGASIDETAAALAVLANAGIKASMGGTTLRSILLSLAKETQKSSEMFSQMGIRTKDLEGNMRPLIDILKDMAAANLTISQAGQLFTTRAASGAIALTKQVDQLERFTIMNQNATGEAKRLSDVLLNNLVGSLTYLKSSLDSVFIAISSGVLSPLAALANFVSLIANMISSLMKVPIIGPVLSTLSSLFLGVTGAVGGLIVVMGGAGLAVSGLMRILILLAGGLDALTISSVKAAASAISLKTSMTPLGTIFSFLTTQIRAAWAALVAFAGSATILTIWAAVIAAAAAAIYLLATRTDKARQAANDLARDATDARVAFDDLVTTLGQANEGTSQHEKIIVELTKKYPALAEQLRITNQSWKEQQEILKFFRQGLITDEIDKNAKAMVANMANYIQLKEKAKLVSQVAEGAVEAGPIAPGAFGAETPGESLEQFQSRISTLQGLSQQARDEVRKVEATIQSAWTVLIKNTDWNAVGTKPLDLLKSTEEEWMNFFNKGTENGNKFVKTLEEQRVPLKDALELLKQSTEESRQQYYLNLQKQGGLPISTNLDFKEASDTADRLVTKFNEDISKKVPVAYRDQIIQILNDMKTPLSIYGAEYRKMVSDDVAKIIEIWKKLPTATAEEAEKWVAQLRNYMRNTDNMLAQMKSPTSIAPAPILGGVNWDAPGTISILEKIAKAYDTSTEAVKGLIQEAAQMPGVTDKMILGILGAEGSFNRFATSSANAMGVMQTIPSTFNDMSESLRNTKWQIGTDPYDLKSSLFAGTKYLSDLTQRFAGQADQLNKVVASYNAGPAGRGIKGVPETAPIQLQLLPAETQKYLPKFNQVVEQISADPKNSIYMYKKEQAQTDEKVATEAGKAIGIALSSGIEKSTATAREAEKQTMLARQAAAETAIKAQIQQLDYDKSTKNVGLEKLRLEDQLNTLRKTHLNEQKQFELDTTKAVGKVQSDTLEVRLKKEQLVLEGMQNQLKVLQSQLAVTQAQAAVRLEVGGETGAAYQIRLIEDQNKVYQDQMGLLNKRMEIEDLTAAIKKRQIELTVQAAEPRAAALDMLRLETLKNRGAIEAEMNVTTNNYQKEQQKTLLDAVKGVKEFQTSIKQLQVEGALGPISEETAKWNKQLWDNKLAQKAITDEIYKQVAAMVELEGMAKGWTREERDKKVADQMAPITAQIDAAYKKKNETESPYIGQEAKRWGDAISNGISQMVDAFMDGSTDLKAAMNTFFKQTLKDSLVPGMKQLTEFLTQGFKNMFASLGKFVGSDQIGMMLGNAIMGAISIVGMMMTSKTSASFTASGVQSQVTQHEAVRGVIAGETSIPIAEISVSLEEAVAPHLDVLRRIEANTRGGVRTGGGESSGGGTDVQVIIQGVTASIRAAMDQYFQQYLMLGAGK